MSQYKILIDDRNYSNWRVYNFVSLSEVDETNEINKINLIEIAQIAFLNWGFNFLKGTDYVSSYRIYHVIYHDIDGLTVSNPVLVIAPAPVIILPATP